MDIREEYEATKNKEKISKGEYGKNPKKSLAQQFQEEYNEKEKGKQKDLSSKVLQVLDRLQKEGALKSTENDDEKSTESDDEEQPITLIYKKKRVKHVASKSKLNEQVKSEVAKDKVLKESAKESVLKRPRMKFPLNTKEKEEDQGPEFRKKPRMIMPSKTKEKADKKEKHAETSSSATIKSGEISKLPTKNEEKQVVTKKQTEETGKQIKICSAPENKNGKKMKKVFDVSQSRNNPATFTKLVNALTPEKKKKVVEDIDFGSFLHIDLPSSDRCFNVKLIESFDPQSSEMCLPFNIIFEIDDDDVENVFALPRGEEDVVKQSNYTFEFETFLCKWRLSWGLDPRKGSPRVTSIVERYTSEDEITKPPNDEFLIHFVICVVNIFLVSRTTSNCHFKFLGSMLDAKKIKQLNWCKYVTQ